MKKLEQEPALVVGVVLAAIGVLTAFGLGISDNQGEAITAFVSSVFAMVGAVVTRSKVTPVAKLEAQGIHLDPAGNAMTPVAPVTPEPVIQALPDPAPGTTVPPSGTAVPPTKADPGGLY